MHQDIAGESDLRIEPQTFDKEWVNWPCLVAIPAIENWGLGLYDLQREWKMQIYYNLWDLKEWKKKQFLISITILQNFLGTATGDGRPGCKAPIGIMVLLTSRKSSNSRQSPFFFLITKMEVFHDDMEGSRCPCSNCSCTNCNAA